MTLTLILTRHAKSDWDDPRLSDHQRPLNKRGRAAAPVIGRWIAGHAPAPDCALISTARRTRETWDGIAAALPPVGDVRFLDALYHAGPEVMLKALQGATGACALMIGHNPGIAEFAARLLAAPPAHPDFTRYPTAATLVATFDAPNWAAVKFGTGTAAAFATPRTLA